MEARHDASRRSSDSAKLRFSSWARAEESTMEYGMQLDHYSAEKLKEQIATIVGWYLDRTKYRVFFFGSRVEGTADAHSDIDVGIDGPAPIPPATMSAIRDGITALPVRRRIDVVDFQTIGEEFRAIALRHTEPIP